MPSPIQLECTNTASRIGASQSTAVSGADSPFAGLLAAARASAHTEAPAWKYSRDTSAPNSSQGARGEDADDEDVRLHVASAEDGEDIDTLATLDVILAQPLPAVPVQTLSAECMTQSCEANALATEASLPTGSSAAHDSPASFSAGATLSLDTAARLEFSTVDECLETDEGLIGANEKQSNNSQIHRANDRDVSFEADVNIVAAATVAAEQALAHGESSQLEHTTDLEILAPQVAAQLPGDPKARTPNPIVTQSAVAQASSSERARAVVALPKSPDQPPPLCSVATQANDALNNNPANNDSLAKDSTSTVPSVSAEATAGENHDNSRKVRSERRDAQMQPSHSQMQPANTIAEIATVVSTSVGERSTTSAGSAVEHAELLPLHTMVETGTTTNQPKAEITEITSASADLAASRHEARSAQAAAAQELVHAVRLLDRLNHSEMRIGLTTEYGRIDIRTVIRDSHVGATIGIEAGELGSALTAQLPALKEALTSHRLDSTVVVYDAGTGHHAGSQHGNARQHPQATSPVPGIASEDPAAPRDSSRLMTGDSDYGTGLNVTA